MGSLADFFFCHFQKKYTDDCVHLVRTKLDIVVSHVYVGFHCMIKKKKKIILVELAGQDAWLPTIVYVTVHLTKIKLKKDCSVGHPDKIYK